MNILYIIIGLILLILGGNWLLKASVGLSAKLNISKIIVGLTVVSFATSAPELIVSVQSALNGFSDIAVGNVVGSNIGNIGLVLGVVLLITSLQVEPTFYNTDWPMMMMASLILFFVLVIDASISRFEGIFFIILLIVFLVILVRKNSKIQLKDSKSATTNLSYLSIFSLLVIGGVALWLGSELLVKSAVNLAESIGVSKRVIAITVVSIGTSIPELASSIIAAIKKETDISIGNIIGSNVFNILSVLGFTALVKPITQVDEKIVNFDIYWLLGFAFVLLPMVYLPIRNSLSFKQGVVLVVSYVVFIYLTVN